MSFKDKLTNIVKSVFDSPDQNEYNFTLSSPYENDGNNVSMTPEELDKNEEIFEVENIFPSLSVNLEYVKVKYNLLINSDIIVREFTLTARNRQYQAFLLLIDGMVNSELVNDNVLEALMMRNRANIFDGEQNQIINEAKTNNITVRKVKKFDLETYISDCLLPQNSVKKVSSFKDAFNGVNMGNCLLFVDTLGIAYDIDVKGFKQRGVEPPNNEVIIKGPQEGFVENIRTNTSLLRRIINNENLIIESIEVGNLSKTKCCICYMQDIANADLVAEVKYRVSNLKIDTLLSSGELQQLIEDKNNYTIPQIISTERPDKASKHLYSGKVVVIVNGNPYVLIMPATFTDFIASPEDSNLKFQFANFSKILRLISIFITLLLPGLYVAISDFHQELLPTELLFSVIASRENVPFPIIFEILLMEISFELIREAGLRVPTPLGSTIGIVGALILGEAAVSASLVSPVLIIIIAITGICSFSIPDFSLNFTFRIYRFIYIILGYVAGFLGISVVLFIQLVIMCKLKSFGSPYINPYILNKNKRSISSYFIPPIWKRERTSVFLHAQKKFSQKKISMVWRKK